MQVKSKDPEALDFGLKSELLLQLIAVFHTHAEVETVVLYGSRAKGTYHPGSDIDLSIMGDHITDTLIGKLEEEIDDLLLPYSFDISSWDLIENNDLQEHIGRVGITIYRK